MLGENDGDTRSLLDRSCLSQSFYIRLRDAACISGIDDPNGSLSQEHLT